MDEHRQKNKRGIYHSEINRGEGEGRWERQGKGKGEGKRYVPGGQRKSGAVFF